MSKQWPNKTVLGLTGNIATGKSTVMRMAEEKGALTLDADKIVHQILAEDHAIQEAVVQSFGKQMRRPDGAIDRAALAGIVFSNEASLRKLEQILHPAVRERITHRIEESDAPVVMIEAIKLLEGDLAKMVDQVWVTRAPRRVQIERLMVCRGMDAETAAVRVNSQNPQAAKVARADVVIDTDGTMGDTRALFDMAWARLPGTTGEGLVSTAPTTKEPPARAAAPEPPRAAEVPIPDLIKEERASTSQAVTLVGDLLIRRARPSDIPAILLLIHRATEGDVKLSRAELLQSFGERSYLLGQIGTEVTSVVGWNTDSTTAVCMDQFYIHPDEAATVTLPAILEEVEASAAQLICEIAMAFLPYDAPAIVRQILEQAGYEKMQKEEMHRAWQVTVEEMQPTGTFIMGKILRTIRVA